MLEAGGSLGSPQTPELQGISVIPARNHEVGQGGRWALTSDSLGAGLEEVLSPWCPCYLHEHILLPVPTWEGCSVSGWSSFSSPGAAVPWSVQLGGLWLPADLGQVGLSWVIPAGPVSGWLLVGAVFWPCQLVRHILQQGHESGAPPLTGKKKHSMLCDSPGHKATQVRFGNWSFPGSCPGCRRPKDNRSV